MLRENDIPDGMHSLIQEAETFHGNLQTRLQLLRRLCSPIERLPEDVLLYIFDLCSSATHTQLFLRRDGTDGARVMSDMLTITAVCSYWRSLVKDSDRYWTSFSFTQERASNEADNALFEMLTELFARSGSRPLSIHLDISHCFPLAGFGLRLRDSHERWKSATLIFHRNTPKIFSEISDASSRTFPILRELTLEGSTWMESTEIFINSPILRQVKLGGEVRKKLCLPWEQIQEFTYYPMSRSRSFGYVARSYEYTRDALVYLQKLRNVERVRLHDLSERYEWWDTTGWGNTPSSHVVLPISLVHLICVGSRDLNLFLHLQRPSLNLTSLELLEIYSETLDENFLSLLHCVPELLHLRLQTRAEGRATLSPSLFEAMQFPTLAEVTKTPNSVLLPKLQSFDLDIQLNSRGQDAIANMLASRRRREINTVGVCTIQLAFIRLKLTYCYPITSYFHGIMEFLRLGGLRIEFLQCR